MNIDVREYLRINPISVHDPTLSENGTDCFLVFPESGEYEAWTQNQLFNLLYETIFGDLVDVTVIPPKFKVRVDGETIEWNDDVHIRADQFREYVHRGVYETFKNNFEQNMRTLE